MKKKIFTILLLITTLFQSIYGYNWANNNVFSDVTIPANGEDKLFLSAIQDYPIVSNPSYTVTPNGAIDTDVINVKGNFNFKWYNITSRITVETNYYYRGIKSISYKFNIYISESSTFSASNATLIKTVEDIYTHTGFNIPGK